MKVNFNQPFRDFYGNPVKDGKGNETMIGSTLGYQLFNLADLNKVPLTQKEKYMAYTLSVRIANTSEAIEISEEESQFLDNVASSLFAAGAYGNIKDILTGKEV